MADYTLSAKITGDSSGFERAITNSQNAITNFQNKCSNVSKKLSSLSSSFAPMSAAASAAGAVSVKAFASFESQMSRVGAISGATGGDFKALTEKAKEMGAKTKFSATESGEALEYMAMAGWKTEDMLEGIEGVMNLAAASGEDLATTSDIVTDALTAFGLKASDSTHFADVLAQASSNANTNVGMMGETFKYVAPVAGAMGFSVEDTAVAIGLMANSGIKASQAGTSLRSMLTRMAAPTKDVSIAMEALGIEISDSEGNMRPLNDILVDLRKGFSGLSEEEKVLRANQIAGKNAMSGMLAVVNASDEDFNKLTEAINNSNGAAEKMAETMMDNLAGNFTQMKSKLEGVAIVIGEILSPYLNQAVSAISSAADAFMNLDANTQKIIVAVGVLVAILAPALMIMSKLVSGVSGVASGLSGLTGIFGGLCSPIGLVLIAITTLGAGFIYLMNTNQEFHDKVIGIWDRIRTKVHEVITSFSSLSFDDIASKATSSFSSITPIISAAIEGIKGTIENFSPAFESAFSTVKTIVQTVGQAVSGFISGLTNSFSSGLNGANGFQTAFTTILGLVCPPLKTILLLFQNFGPQIQTLVTIIGSSLVPIFTTLGTTIGGIASALFPAIQSAMANLIPVIVNIIVAVTKIINTVLPVVISLINQLAPFLVQVAQVIGQIVAALAPMIAQLINSLLPVITNIVTVIMNVIQSIMPALIAILNVVMAVIQAIVPVISNVLSVVISVISGIISAINPIISFIGGVISAIMGIISPIVTFITNIIATIVRVIGTILGTVTAIFSTVFSIISGVFTNISNFISTVINAVSTVISGLTNIVGGVFNAIYSTVSDIMTNVGNYIQGIFNGIETAWNGLTSFVGDIFNGVSNAVGDLVNTIKSFVNDVIGGINWALDMINMIPGVSIGYIPYLLHGTDDWSGGFAKMNEGGRGELTYLPNGTQVIPHDISVKYAKEAARANSVSESGILIDYDYLIEGLADAMRNVRVQHVSVLNGKAVAQEITPLVDDNIATGVRRRKGR